MKIVLFILCILVSFSQTSLAGLGLPGMVPLTNNRSAATDLIYKEQKISSEEADQLRNRENLDISKLEPEYSDIYLDPSKAAPTDKEIKLQSNDLVNIYTNSNFNSPLNTMIFNVKNSENNNFTVYASTSAHSILLNKALLEKLGYYVPPVKWLPKLRVKFNTSLEANNFIIKFGQYIAAPADRWLTNIVKIDSLDDKGNVKKNDFGEVIKKWVVNPDYDQTVVEVQDVLIFDPNVIKINLAYGYLDQKSDILGRRALNSLLIPYSLTNTGESINLFSPKPGRIISSELKVNYKFSENYKPSFDDAKWITRKLSKLTRADFEEIVKSAHYPIVNGSNPVGKLITEKLIQRRNYFVKVILEKECNELEENFDEFVLVDNRGKHCNKIKANLFISDSKSGLLIDGKLTINTEEKLVNKPGSWWVGYGSKFSYSEKESPIDFGEVTEILKSKTTTNIISHLITKFNKDIMPHSDLLEKSLQHQQEVAFQNFLASQTDQVNKVPFGTWHTPTYGVNLIMSRDIVFGSYLGAENNIQLADTIGFSINAGMFWGFDGINPASILTTSTDLVFTKRYIHLTPVKTPAAANNAEFKNMFITRLLKKNAAVLEDMASGRIDQIDNTPTECKKNIDCDRRSKRQLKVDELVADFKNALKIGESFLISTNVGANAGIKLGHSMSEKIKLQAKASASTMELTRLHIFKKDENTIQIYKSDAGLNAFMLSMQLNYLIPIFSFEFSNKFGDDTTDFYTIDLTQDLSGDGYGNEENYNRLKTNSSILWTLIFEGYEQAEDSLNVSHSPVKLTHHFSESSVKSKFLIYHNSSQNSYDEMTITNPENFSTNLVRRTTGSRKGKNYEAVVIDSLNALIDEGSSDFNIVNTTNGNPGDTIFGESTAREAIFEARLVNKDFKNSAFKEKFINIDYRWKGWNLDRKELEKLYAEINKRFKDPFNDADFFSINEVATTDEIQLYKLDVKLFITDRGIDYITNIKSKKLKAILDNYNKFESFSKFPLPKRGSGFNIHIGERLSFDRKIKRLKSSFLKLKQKLVRQSRLNTPEKTSALTLRFISLAEQVLSLKGLILAVGGKDNIYVAGDTYGFYEGTENGFNKVSSNHIGKLSSKFSGPIRRAQQKYGATESEFLIQWILGKL